MKKLILLVFLSFIIDGYSQPNIQIESKLEKDERMGWWRDATFGMFIHWGAYSVAAGEYNGKQVDGVGEWILHNANIPKADYEQFVKQFNPVKFNAKEWVRIAKEAGVKYIVITSKHHDGFCLWDSKITQYDVIDFSPFKRDILKELSDACKQANIKMCFYYSIMDWHEPNAQAVKYEHQQSAHPDWSTYREKYLKPQLAELITKYDPAMLWFDGEWIEEWTEEQGKDLYHYLRTLKPGLIINNRVGKGRKGMNGMNAYENAAGDFGTPEQEILEGTADFDWESCMTMNDTWGYKRNDHNWRTSATLIHNLVDIASKGGNYLLNIGPKADGSIPDESIERLGDIGKWLRINGEAIYATKSLREYKQGDDIRFTQSKDETNLYIIALKLASPTIHVKSIGQPKHIELLGTKIPLKWKKENDDSITIQIPKALPGDYPWTFKVSF